MRKQLCLNKTTQEQQRSPYLVNLNRLDERKLIYLLTVGIFFCYKEGKKNKQKTWNVLFSLSYINLPQAIKAEGLENKRRQDIQKSPTKIKSS